MLFQERKSNKLRDYTTMAGPLGVTHFFLFSRSDAGNVHLRFALHPRGPTLQFRIENYVLSKDIQQAQRHSRAGWKEAAESPPLLVQHGMTSSEEELASKPKQKQLESLTQTMFNAMFPTITPSSTKLEKIKRILLLKRERQEDGTFIINVRHYAITTRRSGVSKSIRKFESQKQRHNEKRGVSIPNLGRLEDVADYLLDPAEGGYTSGSETELDTDNEVDVVETTARRVLSKKEMEKIRNGEKGNRTTEPQSRVEKRAVKLIELGPRLKLRLIKVEEGLCEGRVMWNEFIEKSSAEEKQLDEKWNQRRKEKEARKVEQRQNVERKKQLKKNTKENTGENGDVNGAEEEEWDTDEIEDMLDREANGEMDNDSAAEREEQHESETEDEDEMEE